MILVLVALALPSLAGGAIAGFGTYELFSHILPRDVGVPLGYVFGTLVGLGTASAIFVKLGDGMDFR